MFSNIVYISKIDWERVEVREFMSLHVIWKLRKEIANIDTLSYTHTHSHMYTHTHTYKYYVHTLPLHRALCSAVRSLAITYANTSKQMRIVTYFIDNKMKLCEFQEESSSHTSKIFSHAPMPIPFVLYKLLYWCDLEIVTHDSVRVLSCCLLCFPASRYEQQA